MKSQKLADFLSSAAHLLDELGRPDDKAACEVLARAFQAKPDAEAKLVCSHIERAIAPGEHDGRMALLLETLPPLGRFIDAASLSKDLSHVSRALAAHSSGSLDVIVATAITSLLAPPPAKKTKPAASAEALADYEQRLRSALGTEPLFHAVLAEVKKDSTVTPAQASALALAIAGIPVKTKPKAWEAISARHATLVGGRARAKAEGNRTAA